MIKVWLFEFFPAFATLSGDGDDFVPADVQRRFQEFMRLWQRDEELGFDGIFFSEHHFGQAYSPSPNLLISHLAARTKTIRLGVLGTSTPYATPWRVLEEFGMLDHLTQGRLELGIVSGIPPEYADVGMSAQHGAEVHAETMEIMQQWRTERLLSYQGKHFQFNDINIQPRMYRADPAMWTAAISASSAERAGRHGWKLCVGFATVEQLALLFDAYRAGAKAAGREVDPDDLAIRRQVSFVDRPEDAETGRATAMKVFSKAILDQLPPGTPAPPLSLDEFIVGTPAQVTQEIIRQCRTLGCSNMLFGAVGENFEAIAACHERFGNEVIPALHAAEVQTVAA